MTSRQISSTEGLLVLALAAAMAFFAAGFCVGWGAGVASMEGQAGSVQAQDAAE